MIRLYPRVVQSELGIQELQKNLKTEKDRNQRQLNRLADARQEIQNLHAIIGQAAADHEAQAERFGIQNGETEAIVGKVLATRSEDQALRQKLKLAHAQQTAMVMCLAEAETASSRRWEETSEVSSELADHVGRLEVQASKLRASRDRSTAAEVTCQGLRNAWNRSMAVSNEEHAAVAQLELDSYEEDSTASRLDQETMDLTPRKLSLESAARRLQATLNGFKGADSENRRLRGELASWRQQEHSVSERLRQVGSIANEFSARLEAAIEAQIDHEGQIEELGLARLQEELNQAEDLGRNSREELQRAEYQSQELLEELSRRERDDSRHAEELREQLGRSEADCTRLRERVEGLQRENGSLRSRRGKADDEQQGLQGRLAKEEERKKNQAQRKSELEQELEELKGKIRCTIS